ncbi:MAG TPA: hypothetical protein PKY77_08080 [Phycisphaerae bacterium]|nr:hypothetical protein [Phycisphaerae bacterium]HRY66479.1 hypothetical protein [Phycisphaerae bacterium]HSA25813.1 hypothetical protein [Phycisphaerae bacterium]
MEILIRSTVFTPVVMVLAGLTMGQAAWAQATRPAAAPLKIEAKWGNMWLPATVVKREGGKTLVHYEGRSDSQDEWVTNDRIRPARPGTRRPGMAGAGGAARSGLGGRPSTVPGRGVAASRPGEKADSAGPPVTPADLSAAEVLAGDLAAPDTWSLRPDEPEAAGTRLGGRPITLMAVRDTSSERRSLFERVAGLLFTAPRTGLVYVVHHSAIASSKGGNALRVERVHLAKGQPAGYAMIPYGDVAWSVSPDGTHLLVGGGLAHGADGRLDVYKLEGMKALHAVSWRPYEQEDNAISQSVRWAAMVDSAHVLTTNSDGKLVLWGIPTCTAIYSREIQRSSPPALSPSGKYLAANTDKAVCVLEAMTGKVVGQLPSEFLWVPVLSFRPDGRQVAALLSGEILVWDFSTGKLVHEVFLPAGLRARNLEWAADGYVILDSMYLFDLKNMVVLWVYGTGEQRGAEKATGSFAGRYWYVTSAARGPGQVLTSAVLPHEQAQKAAAGLKMDDLMAVKPGASVSLEVAIGTSQDIQDRVTKSLTERLKADGIRVAAGQPVKLVASNVPGETREITYHLFGRMGDQKASVTEMKLGLSFVENSKTLWEKTQTSGAPMMITLKEGQTANEAIEANRAGVWKFFETCPLPKFVPKARERLGYGESQLGPSGPEELKARQEGTPQRSR